MAQVSDPNPCESSRESIPEAAAGTPFLIVGGDASAGGFGAFRNFPEVLPVPSCRAFVFVRHLKPNPESLLPTLLGRRTAPPVVQAADGMAAEPGVAEREAPP
jgi:chemotaxis response regulator CheB